jgi:hypothetical protein
METVSHGRLTSFRRDAAGRRAIRAADFDGLVAVARVVRTMLAASVRLILEPLAMLYDAMQERDNK